MRIGLDGRLAGPGLGVAVVIRALAEGMSRLGAEVVWFGDPSLAPDSVWDAIPPPGPGFPGLDSFRGRRLVAGSAVDLMHFAANSGWWSRGPVPHVMTVHDVIWSRRVLRGHRLRQAVGHSYLRFAVPRAIAGAAGIVAPSAASAAALRERYGARARVIRHGVAGDWWMTAPTAAGDPYLVAFSGRDPRKGIAIAFEAWKQVAWRGVRLVVLAGAGIPPRLERELGRSQRGGRVDVLPYQPTGRLVEIVAGATALLYPSRNEGFGLPVAEAMAAGVPVITGLAPVTVEIGGDAILRLDPRDPVGSAVGHVERLLDQTELRQILAARGRHRAARLTWQDAIARYQEAYLQAIGR
jgi:glycosyltransferase involved in cell wall biosynthesis